MKQPRTRKVALWLILALLAVGCATIREVSPGESVALGPDQGLLVMDLETNVEFERVAMNGGTVAVNLEEGHHLKLFVVSAGRYHWKTFEMPSRRRRMRFHARRADMWNFSVRPGVVNYPGSLILEGKTTRWFTFLNGRNINHSMRTFEKLEEKFPAILSQHDIVYGGDDRDVFFEHLRQARRSAADRAP